MRHRYTNFYSAQTIDLMTWIQFRNIVLKILLLLLLTYILNNSTCSYSVAEIEPLKTYESIKSFFSRKKALSSSEIPQWTDSIVFINTSFDKELVDHYNSDFVPEGKTPVTNRRLLYHFLKCANESNNYKYIIVDIDLDSVYNDYNDSLCSIIPQMKNIVVARSCKSKILEPLKKKSGLVDYKRNLFSLEFTRFNYGDTEIKSLPLYMYNELTGHDIKSFLFGLAYFDKWSLCQKSDVILFDIIHKINEESQDDETNKAEPNYINMNLFFDSIEERNIVVDSEYLKGAINNKIVIIADLFGTDKHEAYIGELPGSIIVINAYNYLTKGNHIVKWWKVFFLFLFYLIIYIFINSKSQIFDMLKTKYRIFKSDIFTTLLLFVGWGTFFHFTALILYFCFDIFYNAWYPTLWFTFVPVMSNLFKLFRKG